MSGIQRRPSKDWWVDTKRALDIKDELEQVEGVAVNQFQISDKSLIVVTLNTDSCPPDMQEDFCKRSQEVLNAFFAPAKVKVIVLDPATKIDFTVFNPVDFTAVDELATKTDQMIEDFKAKFNQHTHPATGGPTSPPSPVRSATRVAVTCPECNFRHRHKLGCSRDVP